MTAGTPRDLNELYSAADLQTQRRIRIIFNEIYSNNPNSSYSGGQHSSREELRQTVLQQGRSFFRRTYNGSQSWSDAQIDMAMSSPGMRINIYKPDGTVAGSADASQWVNQETERAFEMRRFLAFRTAASIEAGHQSTSADIDEMSAAFKGSLTSTAGSLVSSVTSGNFDIIRVFTGALGGLASSLVGLIPGVKQGLMAAGIFVLSLFSNKKLSIGESWALAGIQIGGNKIATQTGNLFDRGRLNTALAQSSDPHFNPFPPAGTPDPQWLGPNGVLSQPWSGPTALSPGSIVTPGVNPAIVIPAGTAPPPIPGTPGGPPPGSSYIPPAGGWPPAPPGGGGPPPGPPAPVVDPNIAIANGLSDQVRAPLTVNAGQIELVIPGGAAAARAAITAALAGSVPPIPGAAIALGGGADTVTLSPADALRLNTFLQQPTNALLRTQLRTLNLPLLLQYNASLTTRLNSQLNTGSVSAAVPNFQDITFADDVKANQFITAMTTAGLIGLTLTPGHKVRLTTDQAAWLSQYTASLADGPRATLRDLFPHPVAPVAPVTVDVDPTTVGLGTMNLRWAGSPSAPQTLQPAQNGLRITQLRIEPARPGDAANTQRVTNIVVQDAEGNVYSLVDVTAGGATPISLSNDQINLLRGPAGPARTGALNALTAIVGGRSPVAIWTDTPDGEHDDMPAQIQVPPVGPGVLRPVQTAPNRL